MSVLTQFLIMFDTDAKKATTETEGLAGALEDVEGAAEGATGGVDGTTESYNENAVSIGSLTKAMVGLIATYVTFDAIATKVMDNAAGIDSMGKFTQTIGLNIVELDAWGAAAERNGGSAEAFRGTVESLQNSLQEMEITGGGEMINTLAMIGVQATDSGGRIKSAFDILPEIAEAFKNMSAAKSFAFGKKLGLDQGTILMLQQSRFEVDKLVERQKLLSGVTKEGYETAAIFNDQWDDTKRVFNSLWLSANSTILPMLQSVLKGLEVVVLWVRENQTLVEGFFIGVAGAITAIYLPAISSAAAATLLAAAPFLIVGAAIAAVGVAVALLSEDIQAWVNGSKSAIGELVGTFDEFKDKVTGVFDTISKKWADFIQFFTDTKKDITDFLDLSNVFSGGLEIQSGFVQQGATGEAIADNTARGQAMIDYYSSTQLNQGGNVMSQRTQNVNVNVGGANIDARGMSQQQAAQTFNAGMKQNIEMAIGQLDDGVER